MNTTCTPRTTPPPVRSDGVPLPGPGDFVARIHRGAHEIGGSCIELAAGGARLVLDLGRPLGAAPDEDVALPAVAGLAGPVPTGSGPDGAGPLLGVVFSHGHFDHVYNNAYFKQQAPDAKLLYHPDDEEIGLALEAIGHEGVAFIEWPDSIAAGLPAPRVAVDIAHGGGDTRVIRLQAGDDDTARALEALVDHLRA